LEGRLFAKSNARRLIANAGEEEREERDIGREKVEERER